MIKQSAARASIIFTGFLFIYAGLEKSLHLSSFIFVLEDYQLNWPLQYIHAVGVVLPVVEILLGLVILSALLPRLRFHRKISMGAGIFLLLVFLLVIIWGLAHRDLFGGCGCFGGLGGQLSVFDAVRDVIFILIALLGFCYDPHRA